MATDVWARGNSATSPPLLKALERGSNPSRR